METRPATRPLHMLLAAIASAAPVAIASVASQPVLAHADGRLRTVSAVGTASLNPVQPGSGDIAHPEIDPTSGAAGPPGGHEQSRPGNARSIEAPPSRAQTPAATGGPTLIASFDGLTHRDQRLANHGNQFSTEPPDQGLCAGNGFVMESVNHALAVYNESGSRLRGTTDLNTFYGYAPAIVRGSSLAFGPDLTDPSCYFDADTQRWFQVALTLDRVGTTEQQSGANHLDLAVSNTSSPLGGWTVYRIDVTNDGTGGTPNHQCSTGPGATATHPNACFGDFPHIGADRNGIFLSTNEYSLFGPEFHSANIYALPKRALAAHQPNVLASQFETQNAVPVIGRPRESGFTIWPATSPDAQYADAAGGTEYFLSSDAAQEVNPAGRSNRLIFWAITNTRSLNGTPDLHLTNTVLPVLPYSVPARSGQKAGSFPLGQCINDTTMPTPQGPGCWRLLGLANEPAHNEVVPRLDSSDSRILSVTYAAGQVWSDLDTGSGTSSLAGIEWFTVSPSSASGRPAVAGNGYLFQPGENLIYGTIGMISSGRGMMGLTVAGPGRYPSAGYALIGRDGVHPIHIAAEGAGPYDGFAAYNAFSAPNPAQPRWGDYGSAVATGNSVWLAGEYIGQTCDLPTYADMVGFGSCNGTRTPLGNWYTRISHFAV